MGASDGTTTARGLSRRRRLAAALFGSPLNTGITAACLLALGFALPRLLDWAVFSAHWTGSADACRLPGAGACWTFVLEKLRFLTFGFYPYAEQWRPFAAMGLLALGVGASLFERFRTIWLIPFLLADLVGMYLLMAGGVFGLTPVPPRQWGGLPLTLLLAVFSAAGGFPLAVLLALGRRSEIPILKALSVAFIELVRGVPLVSILFMASVMFPLFMPEGVTVETTLRALLALTLFAAAYFAEVIRGGLQAIPKGQEEAAKALGLSYWPTKLLIVLPQALRLTIPPLISTMIVLLKDTSLVVIVGLTDFFGAARSAVSDPQWLGFHVEAYVFVALIYFVLCKAIALYGRFLETESRASAR